MRFPIFFIALFLLGKIYAQCPNADFKIEKDTFCLEERIELINTSVNGTTFNWDFCYGKAPGAKSIGKISDGNVTLGLDIIQYNSNWVGFVTSRDNNKIYRLDFGNDLENLPVVNNIMTNGLLDKPQAIKIRYESGEYFGFILNGSTNELIKVGFGADLLNVNPTQEILLNTNGTANNGFDIQFDGEAWVLIIGSQNILKSLNLGSKLSAASSSSLIQNTYVVPESSRISDISLIQLNNNWFGILTAFGSRTIHKLEFNTQLTNTPSITLISSTFISPDIPFGMELNLNRNEIDGFISTISGNLYKITFNQTFKINSSENLGNFGMLASTLKLKVLRDNNLTYVFTMNYGTRDIYRVTIPDKCSASIQYSNVFTPSELFYNTPGENIIKLEVQSESGCTMDFYDTIFIADKSPPTTSFTTTNTCISNPNTFTATSSDEASVTSWTWDFGDGIGTSSGQNVNYQFLNTGAYEVELAIESQNGCSNTSKQLLSIYNPPQSGFSYTEGVVCSNSPLEFSNSTIFTGPDSIITYQWHMNGEVSLTETNPSYTFTSGGDKSITLIASIPGCSSEISEIINITLGPLTSFTPDGVCVYDTYSFTNNTTGDDITGYLWDFGDGYTSTNTSPTHQFESGGTFAVSLTASNVLGCNTTLKQVVPVHFTPTPNFTNDLACSENFVTFYDQSAAVNANITDQRWTLINHEIDFEQTASGPSPNFQLDEAGNYEMTLIATSNYGCSDTLVRNDINVRPSPRADFIFENLCFGDSTLISESVDLPANIGLNSVEWLIEGILYSDENVKHKFTSVDTFSVEMYVRADNFCTDYTSRNLSILPLPEIGIDLSAFCEDQPVTIYSSINSVDPVIAYNWQINDKPVSNLERFIYDFDKADLYNIGLGVTTENNCYNFQTQEFTIHPSPVSEFELFPSIGANPLNVAFTDLSQGASKVLYDFSENNDDISEDWSPTYTYTTLGKDWPKQIVQNDFGCTDTSYNEVEVVVPVYDLKLSKANIEVIDQKLKMVIEIINNGSIIVNNPEVKIYIDEKISLSHKLESRLWPGDQQSFEIDFDVILNNQSLNYICFALNTELGNYKDVNPYDNSECLSIESTFNVLEPYPNPSRDFVFVPIILPSPGDCQILMANEKGSTLFQNEYKNLKSGLNLFKFDLSVYNQGLYMLVIKHEQFENTKKIVIN